MTKAAFLDRDGTINADKGYVHKVEDFEFITGIFELCHLLQGHGYKIVIISNQSGIGRGYYTTEQLHALNVWMTRQFSYQAVTISETYFCPHHPTEAIGQYKKQCDCRKPAPGMILRAQKALNINLKKSLLVGDQLTDIEAGQKAGVGRNFLIGHHRDSNKGINPSQLFKNLIDLMHFLKSEPLAHYPQTTEAG